MADCNIEKLVKAYNTATTLEERTLLQDAFQHILTERGHEVIGVYNEIYSFFSKVSSTDLDQYLLKTKPGLAAISYPQALPQGHHWAPRYHTHAKTQKWLAKNPIEIELKASKYGGERPIFKTEKQIAIAMEADAFAFANSYEWWKMMVIGRLFTTADKWKKIGAIKADGSDGIRAELDGFYNQTDGATNGYQAYQQGLSLEQNFLCYKDGNYSLCCKENAENCKTFKVTENRIEETLKALHTCIDKNTETATASKLDIFSKGTGSADYAKWVGLIQRVKAVVKEMKTVCTSKYNVCINSADLSKCCDEACSDKLKKLGIVLGCCGKCTDTNKDKCCCYNQTFAKTEDLAIFINPQDVITLEEIYPALRNCTTLELTASNLGVGKIFELPEIESGTIKIINRETVGIHAVSSEYGSADYNEAQLHNVWIRNKTHLVLWPSHCYTIKKAT